MEKWYFWEIRLKHLSATSFSLHSASRAANFSAICGAGSAAVFGGFETEELQDLALHRRQGGHQNFIAAFIVRNGIRREAPQFCVKSTRK